jgi:hypothetical protein
MAGILESEPQDDRICDDLVRALAYETPFCLACQSYNNCEPQKVYGSIAHRIMTRKHPAAKLAGKA